MYVLMVCAEASLQLLFYPKAGAQVCHKAGTFPAFPSAGQHGVGPERGSVHWGSSCSHTHPNCKSGKIHVKTEYKGGSAQQLQNFSKCGGRAVFCRRQMLVSVSPGGAGLVQVYLTGQALKWRSNKPLKWYYHRNMIDQLNSIRDSGQ